MHKRNFILKIFLLKKNYYIYSLSNYNSSNVDKKTILLCMRKSVCKFLHVIHLLPMLHAKASIRSKQEKKTHLSSQVECRHYYRLFLKLYIRAELQV
ncbi:uncharacterized protein ELE39_000877 [Cryptosporidium sp. chipmunk genotype I]|uniref:uncharacterized protein n=1 Tax=Cryptosporidium sp. chipmunk genotype I TaxID=1280935 RepID=UPI00351A2F68|nr:hypothetical protein ELE39_000877 [Cryptosporidium sp. chipmunk genotype I]